MVASGHHFRQRCCYEPKAAGNCRDWRGRGEGGLIKDQHLSVTRCRDYLTAWYLLPLHDGHYVRLNNHIGIRSVSDSTWQTRPPPTNHRSVADPVIKFVLLFPWLNTTCSHFPHWPRPPAHLSTLWYLIQACVHPCQNIPLVVSLALPSSDTFSCLPGPVATCLSVEYSSSNLVYRTAVRLLIQFEFAAWRREIFQKHFSAFGLNEMKFLLMVSELKR